MKKSNKKNYYVSRVSKKVHNNKHKCNKSIKHKKNKSRKIIKGGGDNYPNTVDSSGQMGLNNTSITESPKKLIEESAQNLALRIARKLPPPPPPPFENSSITTGNSTNNNPNMAGEQVQIHSELPQTVMIETQTVMTENQKDTLSDYLNIFSEPNTLRYEEYRTQYSPIREDLKKYVLNAINKNKNTEKPKDDVIADAVEEYVQNRNEIDEKEVKLPDNNYRDSNMYAYKNGYSYEYSDIYKYMNEKILSMIKTKKPDSLMYTILNKYVNINNIRENKDEIKELKNFINAKLQEFTLTLNKIEQEKTVHAIVTMFFTKKFADLNLIPDLIYLVLEKYLPAELRLEKENLYIQKSLERKDLNKYVTKAIVNKKNYELSEKVVDSEVFMYLHNKINIQKNSKGSALNPIKQNNSEKLTEIETYINLVLQNLLLDTNKLIITKAHETVHPYLVRKAKKIDEYINNPKEKEILKNYVLSKLFNYTSKTEAYKIINLKVKDFFNIKIAENKTNKLRKTEIYRGLQIKREKPIIIKQYGSLMYWKTFIKDRIQNAVKNYLKNSKLSENNKKSFITVLKHHSTARFLIKTELYPILQDELNIFFIYNPYPSKYTDDYPTKNPNFKTEVEERKNKLKIELETKIGEFLKIHFANKTKFEDNIVEQNNYSKELSKERARKRAENDKTYWDAVRAENNAKHKQLMQERNNTYTKRKASPNMLKRWTAFPLKILGI